MIWDSVYIVGDSFAEGCEVAPKDSLGSRIAEHYNLPLINKGYAGTSNEYTFRTLYEDVPNFNTKPLLVVVYTNHQRQDFYYKKYDKIGDVSTRPNFFDKKFIKEYYVNHYSNEFQIKKSLSYIKAVQLLLKTYSMDYVECFSMDDVILDAASLTDEKESIVYDQGIPIDLRAIKVDGSHMMDTSLSTKGAWDKFYTIDQLKNEMPRGHLNERGSELVAMWMIEKINSMYPNEYLDKLFQEKYI